MTTVEEWRAFLQKWSDEWLGTDEDFPPAVRKGRWLGYRPATEAQIEQLEQRLGYRLPPSYRGFLATTNGWRRTSTFVERLRTDKDVKWLEDDNPQLVDIWCVGANEGWSDQSSPKAYFSYDGRTPGDYRHFRRSLKIADPIPSDSMIYVLNPEVVAEDGEWEAWLHASWIPGEERFPSFSCLMRAEYESFRLTVLGDRTRRKSARRFGGVYAPDRPRHRAERIGPGTRRKRRSAIEELIEKLEDSSARVRRDAANQLVREFRPHHPGLAELDLTEQLARILRKGSEPDVRIAAAYMLGSSGDRRAIEPLVAALQDEAVAAAAVTALHYLSIDGKDRRIADGLYAYLNTPRDPVSTFTAVSILQELGDRRLAGIALRLLDADVASSSRSHAAFALAATGPSAADQLIARLASENPEIRAAAAAALRVTGDRRAIEPLRTVADDPDPTVRLQAAMSLRFLGEEVPIPRRNPGARGGVSRKKGRR